MMRKLRKLFALSKQARRTLLAAWALLFLVRMGLWCLPFPRLLGMVAFMSRPRRTKRPGPATPEETAWAVNVASRLVPNPTCFTRALALNALLLRQGHTSYIKIGIAKDATGGLKSHAWVEKDGCIILGYLPDLGDYSILASLECASNLLGRDLAIKL